MKLLIFTACLATLVYAGKPVVNGTTMSSKGAVTTGMTTSATTASTTASTTGSTTPLTTGSTTPATTAAEETTAMNKTTPAKNSTPQSHSSPKTSPTPAPKIPTTTSGSSSLVSTIATVLVSSAIFLFNRHH